MKHFVVDSSVAVKWFADEADSDKAKNLLAKHLDGEIEFYAPDLFYSEIGNIFWKKVSIQGFSKEDADDSLEKIRRIKVTVSSTLSLFDRSMQIAVTYSRTFYDSLYIALSEDLGYEFVTADERMFNAVHQNFPLIRLLSSLS